MYDTFETDAEMESKGVIVDYGDFRVRLAHAGQGNTRYVKYAEKMMKPVRRAMEAGSLGNERSLAIMLDIYAKTIILDWQVRDGVDKWKTGIESKDGSILPFNEDNVLSTLKALPNLFLDLQQQATSISNFRRAELEAEAGN
jgi:hypothetical protein